MEKYIFTEFVTDINICNSAYSVIFPSYVSAKCSLLDFRSWTNAWTCKKHFCVVASQGEGHLT